EAGDTGGAGAVRRRQRAGRRLWPRRGGEDGGRLLGLPERGAAAAGARRLRGVRTGAGGDDRPRVVRGMTTAVAPPAAPERLRRGGAPWGGPPPPPLLSPSNAPPPAGAWVRVRWRASPAACSRCRDS